MSKTLLSLLVLAFMASVSLTQASDDVSEVLWDRYQDVLMSFIRKTNDADEYKGLQVVTEPLIASWESGNEDLLNHIMDQSSKYGSLYEPSSTDKISEEYEEFIYNLKFPELVDDPEKKQKLYSIRKDLMDAEKERVAKRNQCYQDWQFFSQISDTFADMSYNVFEDQECAALLEPIRNEIMMLNSDLVVATTKLNGPHRDIVDAISNYATDANVGEYSESHMTVDTFLNRARSGSGTPVSFSLNSGTTLSERRTWIKKKKSGFIFHHTSKTVKKEYRFQSEDFEMAISSPSIGRIDIKPKGDWFSSSIINSYKDKKNMWMDSSKTFFGQNGSLSLVPKAVYVMYNPKVTLKCSEKDAYSLNEMKQSSFSFGPFSSNKGSTLNIQKMNDKNYKVTFDSNSDAAQIVAVDYHVFE